MFESIIVVLWHIIPQVYTYRNHKFLLRKRLLNSGYDLSVTKQSTWEHIACYHNIDAAFLAMEGYHD